MKRTILSTILFALSLATFADNTDIDNGYRWYLQAHINGQYNANEDMRYTSFGKALSLGGDLSIGYSFNDFWGLYLELGYYGNKGAYLDGLYGCNKWANYSFSTFEPTLNVSYNLTNAFLGYKPYRRNALYIHGGLGAAFSFSNDAPELCSDGVTQCPVKTKNQTSFKGTIGFNYVYMFNNQIAFTADASAHFLGDNINGCDWQVPVDARFSIAAGLRFYITKSSKPARVTKYVDEYRTYTDTITAIKRVVVDPQDVYPVFFDTNVHDLLPAQKDIVKSIANQLSSAPSKVVYVLGYSDANSETTDNATLAKKRADVITSELIHLGVSPERIITHDMGGSVQPFLNLTSKNRSTICIITDLKH